MLAYTASAAAPCSRVAIRCARLFSDCVRTTAIVLLISGLLPRHGLAGTNTFTVLGPEGGMTHKILFHPADPTIVYAAAGRALYRSTNGGESWQLASRDFGNAPTDIAVHASQPTGVFLALQNFGVFLSNDNGTSFNQVSTFPEPYAVTGNIEFGIDGTLFVTTSDRVIRSEDFGATWQQGAPMPSQDAYNLRIAADPSNDQTILALADRQVDETHTETLAWTSENGGESWASFELPENEHVGDLKIAAGSPKRFWAAAVDGVWVLEEGGAWSRDTQTGRPFSTVEIDPNDSQIVYVVGLDGLYRRTIEGVVTWSNVQGDARTGNIQTIAIAPDNSSRLLLGGYAGIAGSTDRGDNWAPLNMGIRAARANELVTSAASDRIYVGTSYNGVHFAESGGSEFMSVDNEELRHLSDSFGDVYPFLFGTRGLFVQPDVMDRLFIGVADGIARSLDGGLSWTLITNAQFDGNQVRGISRAVMDGDEVLLAATNSGLYRSTDDGVTWPPVDSLPTHFIDPIVTAPSNPQRAYATVAEPPTASRIYRSDDGGATWEPTAPISTYVLSIAVDAQNDEVLYVGTAQSLLKTMNGGDSWMALEWSDDPGDVSTWAVTIDPQNSNIVNAAYGVGIRRSVDAGATWETIQGPFSWSVRSLAIDSLRPHRLFAAALDDGVYEIAITPDLAIDLSAPAGAVGHDQLVSFNYTVSNEGPFDATEVVATVSLDASAQNISVAAADNVCTLADTTITCSSAVLRNGESLEIEVSALHPNAGTFVVEAALEGAQPDANAQNNVVELELHVSDESDLVVSMQGPSELEAGAIATYSVVASNAGPSSASDVSLQIQLGSILPIEQVTTTSGACTTSAEGLIACEIGTLQAEQSAIVTIAIGPVSAGTAENTVSASTSAPEVSAANNAASLTTIVAAQPVPPPPGGGKSGNGGNAGGGGGGGGSNSAWLLLLLSLLGPAKRSRSIEHGRVFA